MQSFVVITCLLASLAASNPIGVERRSFASGGMSASSQQQQSASSSSAASFNGGGFGGGLGMGGGFGGFGGTSSFNAQSSSSYSSSTVFNSFTSLGSQIAAIQGMMAGGGFSQTIAMQQMSQLAVSMQLALTQSAGCNCLTQPNFIPSIGGVFSQFSSLMMSMQSTFGSSFGSLLQPFGNLSGSFQSFFQSAASTGVSVNSFFPSGLPSLFGQVIPGFTNLVGFQ